MSIKALSSISDAQHNESALRATSLQAPNSAGLHAATPRQPELGQAPAGIRQQSLTQAFWMPSTMKAPLRARSMRSPYTGKSLSCHPQSSQG